MSKSIQGAAMHEAAHCVANWVYGRRVDRLRIDSRGGGFCGAENRQLPHLWEALICDCGFAGEEAFLGADGDAARCAQADFAAGSRFLAASGGITPAKRRKTALDFVWNYSAEIQAVAAELMRNVGTDVGWKLGGLCRQTDVLEQFAYLYPGTTSSLSHRPWGWEGWRDVAMAVLGGPQALSRGGRPNPFAGGQLEHILPNRDGSTRPATVASVRAALER